MRPVRHFLGWDRPLLERVCDRLRSEDPEQRDFSGWLLIVGTAQAGRMLRRELAVRAAERGGALIPPRIQTPQQFLRSRLSGQRVADPVGRAALWTELLCATPGSDLAAILPRLPDTREHAWGLTLARRILQLRGQLTEGGWDFQSVAAHDAVAEERPRWEMLAALEARYRERLAESGLSDPDDRMRAWASAPPGLDGIERFILVATLNPIPLAAAGWERVPDPESAEIWIHAPAEEADRFDSWGRPLDTPSEQEIRIRSPRSCIHVEDTPDNQAAAAAGWIARHSDPPRTAAVGGPDAEVLSALGRELEERGIRTYDPAGRPARCSELVAFLEILLRLDRSRGIDALTDLLRLPAVLTRLAPELEVEGDADLLDAVDRFLQRSLPVGFDEAMALAEARRGRSGDVQTVLAVLQTLRSWMERLDEPGDSDRIHALLADVFGPRTYHDDHDPVFLGAAQALEDLLAAHAESPFARTWTVRDLLRICLAEMAETPVSGERSGDAVELSGWLELAWDARPHLLLTGCNEGRLPASVGADPFLPDSVRQRLGLAHNASRFRRDATMLRALLAMRAQSGRVDFFLGKFAAGGDALTPSRLLLHCARDELPERVRQVFSDPPERGSHAPWTRSWKLRPEDAASGVAQTQRDSVRVTALRDYLACPFRYALRHVYRMEPFDAEQQEMDARDFGNCLHAALESLLCDRSMRDCSDLPALRERLVAGADRFLQERYGPTPPLPVLVQRDSAHERLAATAVHIARWREEGWRPLQVEWSFTVDAASIAAPIGLRGKIDLIEEREDDGALRLVDFKSSDTAVSPDAAHVRRPAKGRDRPPVVPAAAALDAEGRRLEWLDLQLPAYAWAIRSEPEMRERPFEIGYFNMPKATGETGWRPWMEWDGVIEAAASTCAREVLEAIASDRYWPPAERVAFDDFGKWFPPRPSESVAVPRAWSGETGPDPPNASRESSGSFIENSG